MPMTPTSLSLLCPRPVGGGGIRRSSASVVRQSVCPSDVAYIGSNSKTKRPRKTNFAQGYPRSHATPTPTSRSKGQKSRSRGGGILWRPPSRTACSCLQRSDQRSRTRPCRTLGSKNNLKLNKAKSTEIVFTDSRRKSQFSPPPALPDVSRMSLIKILGVTISNYLSVSDHIRDVISKCAHCAVTVRVQSSSLPRDEQRSPRADLQSDCHRKALTRWGFATAADKRCAVVSRTVTFPDRRFPDKTFPGQTISGQDVSRTDVSRTRRFPDRRFPDRRFPDKTFPGQTIPGQTFPGQYVFQAPFYSRWRRARQPFDCQLQTQRSGQQEHNEWRIVNKRSK